MAARTKPVASHDCGVSLYAPTDKFPVYRLVWTDPFTDKRCNRRYPSREVADEWFVSTVDYVKAGAAAQPSCGDGRSGVRTVSDLFTALDARWDREVRSETYRESRAGIYRTWIGPVVGDLPVHEWGADEDVCETILDAARSVGRRPATIQNIGSLLRTLVTTGHKKKWLPRSMNPMADVSYVAKKEAEDESTDYVPPSERPTTTMVEALAVMLAAVGAAAGRSWLGLMTRVAAFGGLRLGELTSLRPMDVDVDRHGVKVDWAWSHSKRKGAQRKRPKNGRRRFVLLPGSVMGRIPVDQSRLRILSAGPPAPATQPDGSPRLNRAGQALTNVPVLVLADGGRAESLTIRVPSPAPALPELAPLRFAGLVGWYWTLDNGRSGVSLTADAVEVVQPRPDVARVPSAPTR